MSFEHILRIVVAPGFYEEERTQSYLDFCLKHHIQNVAFFVNNEENCVGPLTLEEMKPWVRTIKKASKVFREHGIGVQLNPWFELGHLDRGMYHLPEGVHFQTVVSPDGGSERTVACPLDEEWWSFFSPVYSYMVKEIQPDVCWIEDDFRLHNHGAYFYTCFCPHHMKRFNEKLGTNYTREEFVDLVFHQGDMKAREAMLDVFRDTMNELSLKMGKLIHEASPRTAVGLMSSKPTSHCYEARDWDTLTHNLAQGGPLIQRPHLPCYLERDPKSYYEDFNSVSMVIRAFLPKEAKIYPEEENSCFHTYAKEPRFMQFMLEGSLPLCPDGMTYDITNFCPNGGEEEHGYGKAIEEISPYLDAFVNEKMNYFDYQGIVIPLDPKACYYRRDVKRVSDILPDEYDASPYLASLGYSTRISKEKQFHDQVIFLERGMVDSFSDEELKDLFKDNSLIVDGLAAKKLIERSLGYLLHATSCLECSPVEEEGTQAYDEYLGEEKINGISHKRESLFMVGTFYRISYEENQVKVHTEAYDSSRHDLGPSVVETENALILPFSSSNKEKGMNAYADVRRYLIHKFIEKHCPVYSYSGYPGFYSYLNLGEKKHLILVNATVTRFEELNLVIHGVEFAHIEALGHDGKWHEAHFKKEGDHVRLFEPMDYLSSLTLRLE